MTPFSLKTDISYLFVFLYKLKINTIMKIIRKISVGKDYPNGSIHYQVGKTINLLGDIYTIYSILLEKVEGDKLGYNIYIKGEDSGTILWKTIIDMPVHIENDITFA